MFLRSFEDRGYRLAHLRMAKYETVILVSIAAMMTLGDVEQTMVVRNDEGAWLTQIYKNQIRMPDRFS